MHRILFILFLFPLNIFGQAPDGLHVSGRIVFNDGLTGYRFVKIYNQRTGTFIIPSVASGMFELVGYRTDTFLVVCQNYSPVTICYKDSIKHASYNLTVTLFHLQIELSPITVTPDKTFDQIQEEIDKLGVPNTDTYQNYNPMQNPITALWEIFSKAEKDKRKVAVLMNDDQRRNMQRELLKLCIKSDLISLSFSDMDAFIDFCGFTDEYLQHCSFYELLSNIKQHFKYFGMH
ncbi:hypothetical protein LBMAG27_17800 [Bacteroidota bacterium]|nr:hypothetical protein LBMAG27_17800 [Bacteroidota bacterium]